MIDIIINDKYKIEQNLTETHLYELYLAKEIETGTTVVIKFLKKEWCDCNDKVQLFCEEVKSFAQVNHQYAVQVLDLDKYKIQPFVVLEYVEGTNLKEIISEGKITISDSISITKQLAELLQNAHAQKIIKRTIKLSNVLVQKNGKIKVLMFSHPRLKLISQNKGTNLDELIENEAGIQSDIFFLGSTLFECITRKSPLRRRGGLNESWDEILKQAIYNHHSFITPQDLEKIEMFLEKSFTRQIKLRFNSYESLLMSLTDLQLAIEKTLKSETKATKQNIYQLKTASEVVDAINGKIPIPNSENLTLENCVNSAPNVIAASSKANNYSQLYSLDSVTTDCKNTNCTGISKTNSNSSVIYDLNTNHISNSSLNATPQTVALHPSINETLIAPSYNKQHLNVVQMNNYANNESTQSNLNQLNHNASYTNNNMNSYSEENYEENTNLYNTFKDLSNTNSSKQCFNTPKNRTKKITPVSITLKKNFSLLDTSTFIIACSILFVIILFFIW